MAKGSTNPAIAETSLEALLVALRDCAARPAAEAQAFPPGVYCDEAFHRLELERIFAVEWHCIGRTDEWAEPGQFEALEIGGEAVFVVRGKDRKLRAFANVCRHRSARLLEGTGQTARIVCPYHAWNYDLQGRLRSAPYMAEDFDPAAICLPELTLEDWGGFVYLNLAENTVPLAPRLAKLTEYFAKFRLAEYRTLFRVDEIWETNWKCLVENFTEPYHLFHVHAKTVEHALPTRSCKMVQGGDGFNLFEQYRTPGVAYEYDQPMAPVNPELTEEDRRRYSLAGIFPTHVVSVSEERLFWMAMQPLGSARVKVRWGLDAFPGAIPEGTAGERRIADLHQAFDRINGEDKPVIAGVRSNSVSRFAEAGPLSPFERTIWDFQRYLARMLCDAA